MVGTAKHGKLFHPVFGVFFFPGPFRITGGGGGGRAPLLGAHSPFFTISFPSRLPGFSTTPPPQGGHPGPPPPTGGALPGVNSLAHDLPPQPFDVCWGSPKGAKQGFFVVFFFFKGGGTGGGAENWGPQGGACLFFSFGGGRGGEGGGGCPTAPGGGPTPPQGGDLEGKGGGGGQALLGPCTWGSPNFPPRITGGITRGGWGAPKVHRKKGPGKGGGGGGGRTTGGPNNPGGRGCCPPGGKGDFFFRAGKKRSQPGWLVGSGPPGKKKRGPRIPEPRKRKSLCPHPGFSGGELKKKTGWGFSCQPWGDLCFRGLRPPRGTRGNNAGFYFVFLLCVFFGVFFPPQAP